jgi:cytochrome c oxidase cbb3-type subunit 3/ubiquinol-cytochrome c reductase cytochrome c subunit
VNAAGASPAGSVGNTPRPPAPLPAPSSGKELYERYCRLCHGSDAKGYAADNAPSLVSRTFLESASDAFIAQGIRVGRPNTPMAAYGDGRGGPLSEPQISAIVSYLRAQGPSPTLLAEQPPSGDPKRGAALYEKNCRSCHGTATTRATALQLLNPELLASASPAFLRHAIVNGRPPAPMPAFAGKLTPSEIEDILAWLASVAPAAPKPDPVPKPEVPQDLPVVISPRGRRPNFTLREGRYVSAEQVKQALVGKKRMVIVDARSPSDWLEFHIPGSIPIPYYDATQLKRIPNDGTWVIAYCACPHHASGEVVDALRREKYQNTAVLDEGILFWRARGYPLEGAAVKRGAVAPGSSAPTPAGSARK